MGKEMTTVQQTQSRHHALTSSGIVPVVLKITEMATRPTTPITNEMTAITHQLLNPKVSSPGPVNYKKKNNHGKYIP